MRRRLRALAIALLLAAGLSAGARAQAPETPEYRLKAAFLYNFALFTEWPAEVGGTLTLCVVGADPFGDELNGLQGKAVGTRSLAVQRKAAGQPANGCHLLFVAAPAIGGLPRLLEQVRGQPVLVVADSPGAAHQGAALNMAVANNRVSFEANQRAARAAGLTLSSRLLRLATEVIQ
jgi:hypothetical protein